MLYKDNWPEAQKHLAAWWEGKSLGRPAVGALSLRDRPLPFPELPPKSYPDPRAACLDTVRSLDNQEAFMVRHEFLGETFPEFSLNLGPGSLALYLGSEPDFAWSTIWYKEAIDPDNPESTPLPVYNPDNPWWRLHFDMTRQAAQRADGKALASVPDVIEGLDILSALRGPQNTLYDLYDRPEWVHRWLERLGDVYFDYFDRLCDVVKAPDGSNAFTAFQAWGPGRTAKIQCDFAYMIGPDMFAEFAKPYLARQCERLDYTVFHLDGPACIPHVQHLVKIPHLNAIQWTPGSGHPGLGDPCWYDLYHQVRDGGKSLLLLWIEMETIPALLREFGSDGIYIRPIHTFKNVAEAHDYLKRTGDWANGGK